MRIRLTSKEKFKLRTEGALFPTLISGFSITSLVTYYLDSSSGLFPSIGLILTAWGLVWAGILLFRATYKISVIENGIQTKAKLILKSATMMMVNRKKIFELRYSFKSDKGEKISYTKRTTNPNRHTKGELRVILYHPCYPKRNLELFSLPQSIIDKVYHGA